MDFCGLKRQKRRRAGKVTTYFPLRHAARLARTTVYCWEPSDYLLPPQKEHLEWGALFVVGGGGFEPPKSETSDLQSDAFGHSAIRPYICLYYWCCGAGDWNRTRNLLITNQLLCQLSYTSKRQILCGALGWNRTADIWIFSPPLYRLSYQGIFIISAFLRRL